MPSANRSRNAVAHVDCPRCGARAGKLCRRTDGVPACNERVKLYQSRDRSTEMAEAARLEAHVIATVLCPRCGAKPGERCQGHTCTERRRASG